jgi:cytochrome b pre-mRNA-processing protein 3
MIFSLFARLTAGSKRGEALFHSAVAEARRPHWFVEGGVPDTVEGRFAMLATVIALIMVRLERSGPEAEAATVALTERFIEVIDAEVREMGVGDPALGRQVRALLGALATRVERWRAAIGEELEWTSAVLRSVYRDKSPDAEALAHTESALRSLWLRLERSSEANLVEGRLG